MSTLTALTDLIGPQALGDHLTAAVDDLTARHRIPRPDAYRQITDRADDGDPAILAATGQTWIRRADVSAEEAPAKRLVILERTTFDGIFVLYRDLEAAADDTDDGPHCRLTPADAALNDGRRGADLPVAVLDLYELESWYPPEFLLPTVHRPGAQTS
ncbi:hypothetical protein ABT390_33920 [Streptomyces aurantiacus]|uniref:Uncharacterized protein n=1 Tax=Streptomyces aurantiacus JA 4570 TaxID=1286094 RepID=S3ZVT0_9ACTN|nr:hypothetical protein [Streptomyces aurantiacus]EPH46884.1 hypothetical protein STRAU_0050 [Streptomyces aurantiacus JA 4570]